MSDDKNSSLRDLTSVPSPIFRPTRDLLTLEGSAQQARVERVAKAIAPAISGVPAHLVFGGPAAGAAAPPKYRRLLLGNNDLGDTNISAPTTGQVLKYNGSKWVNGSAGSSGIAASGPIALIPMTQGAAAGPWADTTFCLKVPFNELLTTGGTKFKLVFKSDTANVVIGAACMKRTVAGNTSYIDSTTITWSGATGITCTGSPITNISDEMTGPGFDTGHDYYFLVYATPSTSASSHVKTEDLTGAMAGLTGGTASGNQTSAVSFTGYANLNTLFGIAWVQVTG